MFGIFTSRPEDFRTATNNQNVDTLVNNLHTQESFYELSLKKEEIYSLTKYGLSQNAIKENIEPAFYSYYGSFKDIRFEIVRGHAKVEVFVGKARNLGPTIDLKFYKVITTGKVIQQYDVITHYKFKGGWLGKVLTGDKRFSHNEQVKRDLNASEFNLINKKLLELNDKAVKSAKAKLS